MVGILAIVGPSIAAGAKVAEYLVEPIKNQYIYLFRYKRNIGELKNEAKILENMRAGVQLLVDEAKRNLKIIGLVVEEWLSRVEEIQKETELVLLTAARAENRRWLSYSLSRKAVKKIKVIVELQGKSKFDHVSYDPHPPMVTAPMSFSRSEGFESRFSIMRDVMEALKEDKIHLIGVCGMGGVGKTTMVKDIAAKVIEERLFDEVVMAVVTQSPDLKSIQGSIAELMGLKLEEESLLARAARLCERLKGHTRVLVILDDIWGRLDLEELGIPLVAKKQHKGSCTIVLTSRSADACEEMRAERIFRLKPMPHEEAWVLFQSTADELFHPDPDLFRVAEDIVVECGGLPLAIVTIARALRSKKQKFMWDNALQSLRNSNLGSDYAAVYSALEVSYKFLESDELKHLFLLCCLFPQGYDIPVEDLLRFGLGLRLFTYMDWVDMTRTRANACIQKLKNLNLLLDSRDEECVRIHDLVHTFALSVASRQEHLFVVRHCNGVMFWPRGDTEKICTKISLWYEKIIGLPAGLDFPKLDLLLLVGSSDLSHFPQSFYEGMRQLKVLIHRGMLFDPLPISFQHLSTLQTLSLDYCTLECDISMIGNLVNLEILSFVHSNVKEIPEEIGNLTRLRLLDLTGCVELLKIASGVLERLIRLEELYMRGTILNWPKEQTKACLGELTSLSFLAALEIELPSFEFLPEDMVYEKLTRFRICIGFAIESQVIQNTLKLAGVDSWKWSGIRVPFWRVEILHLKGIASDFCKYPAHSLKWSAKEDFSKLRTLTVEDCRDLEYLVETSGWESTNDFAMLESLHLHFMWALKQIWHIKHSWMCRAQQPSFGNLRVLDIVYCTHLEYVFSLSTARGLVKLESVKIAFCWALEEIFSSEDEKVVVKIELPKLKSLKLEDLPVLACFCKKADAVVLPELVDLELVRLPKFTYTRATFSDTESKNHASSSDIISKQKIALRRNTEVSDTTKKLTEIESDVPPTLYDAKLRVSVFPSHWIPRLHCLEVLDIRGCLSVEVVFDLQAPIVEGRNKSVVLNSLRVLQLSSLQNMIHVWKHGFETFEGFKNLTKLSLDDCDSIIYLFSTLIANFLVQLQELFIKSCENMEVIAVKEENGLEMAAKSPSKIIFPRLTSIQLYRLPRLRCFCSDLLVEFEWPLLESLKIDHCEEMLIFTAGKSSTPRLRDIYISSREYSFQGDINSTLWSAQSKGTLFEDYNNYLDSLNWSAKGFTNLRTLKVRDRHELVYLVTTSGREATNDFAMMESLYLHRLSALTEIWHIEHSEVSSREITEQEPMEAQQPHSWMCPTQLPSFRNLRVLDIVDCRFLKYVFSLSAAQGLVKLEIVKIAGCPKMEEIFSSEDEKAVVKIELPKLKSLKLLNLPVLACFCQKADAVVLPELVDLELERLPVFTYTRVTFSDTESKNHASSTHLFLKLKIALGRDTEVSDTTKKLTKIESDIPPTLYDAKSVLLSQSIQSLHHLQVLDLASCRLVEVVFDLEASIIEGGNKAVVLNSLKVLKLSSLQNMTHVWKHGFKTFEGFKNLTKLSLDSCLRINYLFSTLIANFLVQLQELVIKTCLNMEVIVKEENGLEMAAKAPSKIVFPHLMSIQLCQLPKLRCFCSGLGVEFGWPLLESVKIDYCEEMLVFTAGNSTTPRLRDIDINLHKYSIQRDVNSTLRSAQHKGYACAARE